MSPELGAWGSRSAVADSEELAFKLPDGRWLARRVVVARSVFSRFMGLMGRSNLDRDEGLWLIPCRSIHMFFMRTAIDVAFLSRQGQVVRTASSMRPWSLRPIGVTLLPVAGAHSALELAPGTLDRLGVAVGDQLAFAPSASVGEVPGFARDAGGKLISNSGE